MRLTNNKTYCEQQCDYGKEDECFFDSEKEQFDCYERKIYDKLKEYEDLEEQGLLVKFPCKLGDDLYWIDDEFSDDMKIEKSDNNITGILVSKDGFYVAIDDEFNELFKIGSQFGLLSKEQAEQKLRQQQLAYDNNIYARRGTIVPQQIEAYKQIVKVLSEAVEYQNLFNNNKTIYLIINA